MDIIIPELATAVDGTKLSDRKTVFVVAKTIKSLGYDIQEVSKNVQQALFVKKELLVEINNHRN